MTKLLVFLQSYIATRERHEDRGATMVEYGLMVALIAIICLVAVTAIGVNLSAMFAAIAAAL